jgi:tetratricopeptide (TPR) repeat protein
MEIIIFLQQYLVIILLALAILNWSWKIFRRSELFLQLNIILFPNNAEKHFALGYYLYDKKKKLDNAEKELRQAVALNSQDYRYLLVLGYVLQIREKYGEAFENYQRVVKLNPHDASAFGNIGILLHEEFNRFDEAEQAYRRSIELNPQDPLGHFQLGWLLLDRFHRYEEAESHFFKTLELNPQDETALYNLACIKSFSQDSDLAFDYLRKAIEKGFDKNWAWNDKDLEWLQNDLRFTEIVGPRPNKD